ncbi:hypothetical protein BO78DRAFT_385976 [Aspergillus sclerotiicarbonarius CBS 121057]|uniref:BZIP domain-containing protein n=1 Tax=Aspergillus sclerotiicarbonarius (strain CBS 121057 / IBT 28362) TaxID=1448318 RepID=A0A319EDH1_ASPSB|nr:hypothetical protein BO78DRAFT_385976 [Aspergillus sclerotiicarbonarius CBS 121057]
MASQDSQDANADLQQQQHQTGISNAHARRQLVLPLDFASFGDSPYVVIVPSGAVGTSMPAQAASIPVTAGGGLSPSLCMASSREGQWQGMLDTIGGIGDLDAHDIMQLHADPALSTPDPMFDSILDLPSPSALPPIGEHDPTTTNSAAYASTGVSDAATRDASPNTPGPTICLQESSGTSEEAESSRLDQQRRRNSQASARFRQRRRERERELAAGLEASRGEVRDLRSRIQELRAENNLLRDILMNDRLRRGD